MEIPTKSEINTDKLSVIAGLLLTLLLPLGMSLGIKSPVFMSVFFAHLAILLAANFIGLKNFWQASSSGARAIAAILLAIIIAVSSVPITSRDALIHHMAVPKWWAEVGYIYEIPWHEWSYYPMLLDFGFTGFLALNLEWACNFYHGLYLILLAAAVSKVLPANYKSIGFLITLSLPIAIKLATIPVVDLGLSLYCLLAITFLVSWTKERSLEALLYAGSSLGLALGTKYNGLLFAAFFAPLSLLYLRREGAGWIATVRSLAIVGVISALVFAPWCIKNILWTGNPVFPLMRGTFGPISTGFALGGMSPLEQQLLLYNRSVFEIILSPLMMLFLGKDESPAWFDGVLSPFLILAMFAVWKRRGEKRHSENWVIYLAAIIVTYWAFASVYAMPRVRYLSPLYGPLIILSIAAFKNFPKFSSSMLAVHGVFVVWYMSQLISATHVIEWLNPTTTKQSYLRAHIPEYKLTEFINESAPSDARIYLLYSGNRFYYINRDVRSNGHFSGGELIGWIKEAKTPENLLQSFKNARITHVFMNHPLLNRGLEPNISPEERVLWDTFASKYLELLRQEGPFSFWRLKPAAD